MSEAVEKGTLVYYHGSKVDQHAFMVVTGSHEPYHPFGEDDTIRYYLRYSPEEFAILRNVRPRSFTVVKVEDYV